MSDCTLNNHIRKASLPILESKDVSKDPGITLKSFERVHSKDLYVKRARMEEIQVLQKHYTI